VRDVPTLGARILAHASAAGKAMLAHLPDAEVDQFLAGPLRQLTPRTITDPDALRRTLAQVRRRGWGDSDGEAVLDVSAVAAPVLAHDRPVGAIGASLPTHRKTAALTRHLGARCVAAADEVTRLLGARARR
jgi:IclR family acetate operon transcriptional repressor